MLFTRAKDDGSVALDSKLEVFKSVVDAQPLFAEYLTHTYQHDVLLSHDSRTRHLHNKLALQELLNPTGETNRRTRDKTIEYSQVQCAAGLEKIRDPKLSIADKLNNQGGANAFGKNAGAHTGKHSITHLHTLAS